jgi:membrane protein implicated in regulation of membrane protease activity
VGARLAPAADWVRAEREARHAAAFVAAFVGVPAAVAAGAALMIFALTALVLLAPLVAAVLTWIAWRYGRPEPRP